MIKPKIFCIYKITCLVSNNFYIGSTTDFKRRRTSHLYKLRKNLGGNQHLQNAFNKYGEENFIFEILEEFFFPINYEIVLIKEYIEGREQYYIDNLNPQYNMRIEASSNFGYKPPQNTIDKMKIAAKARAIKLKDILPEIRRKSILVYDLEGNFIREYKGVDRTAKDLNISKATITNQLVGKVKYPDKYIFKEKIGKEIPLKIEKALERKTSSKYSESAIKRRARKIKVFIEEKYSGTFESIKEIAEFLNINESQANLILHRRNLRPLRNKELMKYRLEKIS